MRLTLHFHIKTHVPVGIYPNWTEVTSEFTGPLTNVSSLHTSKFSHKLDWYAMVICWNGAHYSIHSLKCKEPERVHRSMVFDAFNDVGG